MCMSCQSVNIDIIVYNTSWCPSSMIGIGYYFFSCNWINGGCVLFLTAYFSIIDYWAIYSNLCTFLFSCKFFPLTFLCWYCGHCYYYNCFCEECVLVFLFLLALGLIVVSSFSIVFWCVCLHCKDWLTLVWLFVFLFEIWWVFCSALHKSWLIDVCACWKDALANKVPLFVFIDSLYKVQYMYSESL